MYFLKQLFKKSIQMEPGVIYSPIKGEVMALSEIPDDTFASGALGPGIGIKPQENKVYAPCSGTISHVAKTGHSIILTSDEGIQMLIHVGIDTVEMAGHGFHTFCQVGDQVEMGQKLIHFDRRLIKAQGYSDVMALLFLDNGMEIVLSYEPVAQVRALDKIIKVKTKERDNG